MHKVAIPQAALDEVLNRRESLHVFSHLDPLRTAHIVVDLQNVFMAPGQLCETPVARDIVPNVNRISSALRAAGGLVVYTQHTVDAVAKETWSTWFNYLSGEKRRERMEAAFADGSDGHALWPQLEIRPGDLKVNKRRFSAFAPGSSELHAILKAGEIDTIIVTGTASNGCCDCTARDAMMMNYKVVFVSDGTATDCEESHNAALAVLLYFADVMSTDEVVRYLSMSAGRQARAPI